MEIKIRGISETTVKKIDELRGSKSRNEYLLQILEQIAIAPELNYVEDKYADLLKRTNKVISENTEVLNKIFELE